MRAVLRVRWLPRMAGWHPLSGHRLDRALEKPVINSQKPTAASKAYHHPTGFFARSRVREAVAGYLFILPNFLGFLLFTSLPVLASLLLSFFDWDILTPPRAAVYADREYQRGAKPHPGWQYRLPIKNFVELVGFKSEMVEETVKGGGKREVRKLVPRDPQFWKYCWNTLFLMMSIPIGMAGSLGLALLMNQKLRGIVIFRTVYFLPSITAGVALYMLWRWIYNPDFGLLNAMLMGIGKALHIQIPKIEWLSSTFWSKPALMIMGLWTGVGGTSMIIYLAGLQTIPQDLYEAADIDGASGWQKFLHVTWPMLSPQTFFIFTMSVIGGFQGHFESAYIMTQGGPAGSTTTISYYIYNHAFQWFHMGYAAAISWFLFVIIFLITLANWRFGGKHVQYV